jgi:hypothetical protein
MLAAPAILRSRTAEAMIIRSGKTIFVPTPDLVNLFSPLANTNPTATGLMSADLTPDGLGNYSQRVNLGNLRGNSLIPSVATAFRVACQLFRVPVPSNAGGVDASLLAMLDPTAFGLPAFSVQAKASSGPWVEDVCRIIEFPNYTDSKGRDRCFYWQVRGQTPLHAIPWLQLVSYDVPDSYVTPTVWPVRNPGPSSLMLYFGTDGYTDASPFARTVTAHNSSIQGDNSAAFNGTSSYLSFAGSDSGFDLSGDFTIEMTIATNTRSNGGVQIRILSLGASGLPAPAIGIDPSTGAIQLYNEYTAQIYQGGVNICTGVYTTIKWCRESGVNTLSVNGQQDGQPFTNTTSWHASATAEIGRLNGQNVGMFTGNMLDLNIVKGVAL